MRRASTGLWLLAALACSTMNATAQVSGGRPFVPLRATASGGWSDAALRLPAWSPTGSASPTVDLSVARARIVQSGRRLEPGLALATSALLPGTGQYLLGSDRWVPYIAVEVWAWLTYLDRRGDGQSLADDYRNLAWFVARRVSVGERRDTIWEYYEAMTHFAASGTWDRDPQASGVQPELDPTTFNGDLWALARSLYFPGGGNYQPGSEPYQRALGYYLSRAIPPTFTWAWGDSNLEQQSFRELIRRSDDAYRASTQVLGLILVNHLVSAVDALVIARLQAGVAHSRLRIGSGLESGPGGVPRLRIGASWRW